MVGAGELYVWRMVVKLEVVVDDGVVDVVGLDQVLEGAWDFLGRFFDIDRLDGWEVELHGGSVAAREEVREEIRSERKHGW